MLITEARDRCCLAALNYSESHQLFRSGTSATPLSFRPIS
uniref:Uncharacterized protein n=1 Tax=Anguilla anguilla TaxID=7936 RepID=A0A0E9QE63_ANGAN